MNKQELDKMDLFFKVKAIVCDEGGQEVEVRKFVVDKSCGASFTHLRNKLVQLVDHLDTCNFTVRWKDEQGDMVTMSSDEELMVAQLETCSTNLPLTLYITKKKKRSAKCHCGGDCKCEKCECENCDCINRTGRKAGGRLVAKPLADRNGVTRMKREKIPAHIWEVLSRKYQSSPPYVKKVRPGAVAISGRRLPAASELLHACISVPNLEVYMSSSGKPATAMRPCIRNENIEGDVAELESFMRSLLAKSDKKKKHADLGCQQEKDVSKSGQKNSAFNKEHIELIKQSLADVVPQIVTMKDFLKEMNRKEVAAAKKTENDVTKLKRMKKEEEGEASSSAVTTDSKSEKTASTSHSGRSSCSLEWALINDDNEEPQFVSITASSGSAAPETSSGDSVTPAAISVPSQVKADLDQKVKPRVMPAVTVSHCPMTASTSLISSTTAPPVMAVIPPGLQHQKPSENETKAALATLQAMGFSNDHGWLHKLLEAKQGNIDEVLKAMSPKRLA